MKLINSKLLYLLFPAVVFSSCKKFVATEAPKTELVRSTVFTSDVLVNGALSGIYAGMAGSSSYAGGDIQSYTLAGGTSSDELVRASTSDAFFTNALLPNNSYIQVYWTNMYQDIYRSNSVLEGLAGSTGVTESLKMQAAGEAKFIRAFSYFYLVNLFGDVPLVLSTDYRGNALVSRTPKAQVYQQIIADLKDAEANMAVDYTITKGERIRAIKWTAAALLARVYLYTGDWANAASEATSVINNSSLYGLVAPGSVFLKNSTEAIWQFGKTSGNANEALIFPVSTTTPLTASVRPSVVAMFDNNDKRKTTWIVSNTFSGTTYYYPAKYKETVQTPVKEYSTVLRLAEQYLIRAEARAQQGLITGAGSAKSDVDAIRLRAGLAGTAAATKADMLSAIENERLFEYFAEWGHRWLDLKRTGRGDAILGPLKPNWASFKLLFPIPQLQIDNDPAMTGQQNTGYN